MLSAQRSAQKSARALAQRWFHSSPLSSTIATTSVNNQHLDKKFYDVPEGHMDSDLSQIACNIGLNRRRDLKLGAAGNVKVVISGKPMTLETLLKDNLTVIFGVPDRGSVCSKTHVPGYLKELDALRKQGITQIVCVSRGDPATVDAWGKETAGKHANDILFAADPNGGLTRLLGMDVEQGLSDGPQSLRYSLALEDGIILKVMVEKNLGDVNVTSGSKMVEFLKSRPGAQ